MEETPQPVEPATILFSKSKNLPQFFPQVQKLITKSIDDATMKVEGETEDFHQIIQNEQRAVFVFSVFDREELSSLISFLPLLKNAIKERKVLVAVFLRNPSEKVEELLLKSGCYEVLRYDATAKAFLYKLKRYLVYIRPNSGEDQTLEMAEIGGSKTPEKTQDTRVLAQKSMYRKKTGQINIVDALSVPFDFWLFRKDVYAKKYKNQWLIEIIGPSLAAGKWFLTKEFDSVFPKRPQIWKWVPRDATKFGTNFHTEPNVWVFIGNQPEYNWVNNRWGFISDFPELSMVRPGEATVSRFKLIEEGDFNVTNNSKWAMDYFDRIKETFDKDYYLQIEKLEGKNITTTPDEPPNIPWADKTNSKGLSSEDWKMHDLKADPNAAWNDLQKQAEDEEGAALKKEEELAQEAERKRNEAALAAKEEARDLALAEAMAELDIPLGADAMKDCGIRARMKDSPIDLVGYSEAEHYVLIALQSNILKNTEMVEIDIESDNLKIELDFSLRGLVREVQEDDLGRSIVKVTVHSDSYDKIKLIREAIEKRQEEIFRFFDKAKGIA